MKKTDFNSEDLKSHVLEITKSMIIQIESDNVIHSWESDKHTVPDAVANHHLIDLLSELNPKIFHHYCNALFSWLADSNNGYSTHPFTLDSYTKFCGINKTNADLLKSNIADKQLKDGRFTIYTALLPGGGDYFSTLWATKILVNYDKKTFKKQVELAINYLIQDRELGAQTSSQKGFLLFLLLRYNPQKYDTVITGLVEEIVKLSKKISFSGNVIEAINDIYIIEDLIELYKNTKDSKILTIIQTKLDILFDLKEEFHFPPILEKYSSLLPQSPYFQLLIRSALIANKFLNLLNITIDIDLNSYLHLNYRKIKYAGEETEYVLKKYKKHYEGIENEFQKYDSDLKEMWDRCKSDYDHSIFIMMPFKEELTYRTLTNVIKSTCENLGFKAFRVDDDNRRPYDILWENIVINMLSCKYGISVYVSEKTFDQSNEEYKFFHNPNVAMEYGFMKSRGKKVLILKDKKSITPSDLQGFLWKPFDISNPDKTVPPVLSKWLQDLIDETKNKAT
jgi:hypothetical protein